MDWLDLFAVQGTFKRLLQHHSSKAAILWHSAFFMIQLSHPYMITGKIIALTRWIFVSKVICLLFNTLSRFVTDFLPGSKHLLISGLQSPPTVILKSKKIKLSLFPLSPLLYDMKWRDWMSVSYNTNLKYDLINLFLFKFHFNFPLDHFFNIWNISKRYTQKCVIFPHFIFLSFIKVHNSYTKSCI